MCNMQHVWCNLYNGTCNMQHIRCNVYIGQLVRPAGRTSWTDQLNGLAGRTSWTDKLGWIDQLDRPVGWTSYFYLKPWPVRIFKDWTFSLYIVAASMSVKDLVYLSILFYSRILNMCKKVKLNTWKIYWDMRPTVGSDVTLCKIWSVISWYRIYWDMRVLTND